MIDDESMTPKQNFLDEVRSNWPWTRDLRMSQQVEWVCRPQAMVQ
jgi:hypothetical protein